MLGVFATLDRPAVRTEIECSAGDRRKVLVRCLPAIGSVWLRSRRPADVPPHAEESIRLDVANARALRDALNAFLGEG